VNRVFFSLYLVIAAAILIVGWGLDKLWQTYYPEPQISKHESAFFSLMEERLLLLSAEEISTELEKLNKNLDLELSVYSLDELAKSSLSERILSGEMVSIYDDQGRRLLYKTIRQTDSVLMAREKAIVEDKGEVYSALIFVFYLLLAVVVYFWVWPLSRDLRLLEKQTNNVGKEGIPQQVILRSGSNVQHLADAFNVMSNRVNELMAARKEMTYAVSHELRTPLARMKFALEMMESAASDENLGEKLKGIREDVKALDVFVNELLSYASFDQDTTTLDVQQGDFQSLCESIMEPLQNEYSHIRFSLKVEPRSKNVACDWLLMERVVSNLLENALRYTGSVISLSLCIDDSSHSLWVEDDGPGIPADQRERIFQSFTRINTASVETKKGYGLGLAIVKRVMLWHGGNCYVEESPLGGARFVLQWPRE